MQQEKGFIKYIVIVGIIAAIAAVLSQQAFFRGYSQVFYNTLADNKYAARAGQWVNDNLFARVSGEVQKRGETIKTQADNEIQKTSENISEKIKNYFSGISDAILHPSSQDSAQESATSAAPAECPVCTCPAAVNPFTK